MRKNYLICLPLAAQVMDPDKFDKEHRYNIRHSYGQEGKKTNYSAFSCMKIIVANPPGKALLIVHRVFLASLLLRR